jgi:uncharacterized protein
MSIPQQIKAIPARVEPRRLANQGVSLSGEIPATSFERLSDAIVKVVTPAQVSLQFDRNEQGKYVITGSVSMTIEVECHRCLQPMREVLSADIAVKLVWSEDDVSQVSKEWEPWVVASESMDMVALVEEELLLALPIVSYHPEQECTEKAGFSTGELPETAEPQRSNPFDVLKQLKK